MAKNYDIQTVSLHMGGAALSDTQIVGAVVPSGMTRYVTFVRANPLAPTYSEGSKLYLCSTALNRATTDALAIAAQKMVIQIASASVIGNKDVMVPPSPDTEHPLFTIASDAYLYAHQTDDAGMSSSVQLFVQYFDQ